jgi:hypothetical protein
MFSWLTTSASLLGCSCSSSRARSSAITPALRVAHNTRGRQTAAVRGDELQSACMCLQHGQAGVHAAWLTQRQAKHTTTPLRDTHLQPMPPRE